MRRLILIILVFGALSVSAEVYKCEQSDGTTVFSQEPCSDNATTVEIKEHKVDQQAVERSRYLTDKAGQKNNTSDSTNICCSASQSN